MFDGTDYILSIAGGNNTLISLANRDKNHQLLESEVKDLYRRYANMGIEQLGFLSFSPSVHLEMSGGEFCLNATHAAAVIAKLHQAKLEFSVSGFTKEIKANVESIKNKQFLVQTVIDNSLILNLNSFEAFKKQITTVYMSGITHLLLQEKPPQNPLQFAREFFQGVQHRFETSQCLGLIWYEIQEDLVKITPIVWVKALDLITQETACGSGSLAVAYHTGLTRIVQPTGQELLFNLCNENIKVKSQVEIILATKAVGQRQFAVSGGAGAKSGFYGK